MSLWKHLQGLGPKLPKFLGVTFLPPFLRYLSNQKKKTKLLILSLSLCMLIMKVFGLSCHGLRQCGQVRAPLVSFRTREWHVACEILCHVCCLLLPYFVNSAKAYGPPCPSTYHQLGMLPAKLPHMARPIGSMNTTTDPPNWPQANCSP